MINRGQYVWQISECSWCKSKISRWHLRALVCHAKYRRRRSKRWMALSSRGQILRVRSSSWRVDSFRKALHTLRYWGKLILIGTYLMLTSSSLRCAQTLKITYLLILITKHRWTSKKCLKIGYSRMRIIKNRWMIKTTKNGDRWLIL